MKLSAHPDRLVQGRSAHQGRRSLPDGGAAGRPCQPARGGSAAGGRRRVHRPGRQPGRERHQLGEALHRAVRGGDSPPHVHPSGSNAENQVRPHTPQKTPGSTGSPTKAEPAWFCFSFSQVGVSSLRKPLACPLGQPLARTLASPKAG